MTTSAEEVKSINRLWILISYRSQVLEPSPQGLDISFHPSRRDQVNLRLSGGVLEDLGGESNGSLDVEVPVLGSVDEITTD